MQLTVTANIDALLAFSGDLKEFRARASDLTPVFAAGVDPYLTEEIRQQFATEGAHFGDPWEPLAQSTLERRRRDGHGRGGILRDTDALYNAFVNPFDSGAVRVIAPQGYARGVSIPYYPYLHDGTQTTASHRGGMPARPVVPYSMPPEMRDDLFAILARFIVTGAVSSDPGAEL